MAQCVAGELYESVTGQLFEIDRQLRQPGGYPYDPVALNRALQELVEGRFPPSLVGLRKFDPVKFPSLGKGWEIATRDERSAMLGHVDYTKVIFDTGLREGEFGVKGDARRIRILGRQDAVALNLDHFFDLWTHPEKIPELFKQEGVTFDGDELRSPEDGDRYVLFLYWRPDRWHWRYAWQGNEFSAGYRAALLAI